VQSQRRIEDHLIAQFEDGKARIRLCEGEATLTIKGPRNGLSRKEYHVSLAQSDASAMIEDFAKGPGLEKVRHEVAHGGSIWQVDEYLGSLTGLVTADVELKSENQTLDLPDWVGKEITGDARLSSSVLANAFRDPDSAAQVLTLYGTDALNEKGGADV